MDSAPNNSEYEYVIVGAGPAGLQIAYVMEKAKRNYVVIEAGPVAANNFVTFPRHRTLISINKRFNIFPEDDYNFRHDWNSLISDDKEMRFTKYSDQLFPPTDRLVDYMADYAKKFNLNIVYNTRIENIRKEKEEFFLRTNKDTTLKAQVVIMACGAMKENLPDIPGIDLVSTYANHTLDQSYYENKKIAVVGGGNSGFETADHLAGHAGIIHMYNRSPFKMAWDTHFPGNLRAVNNNILDMFHLKSLHALREAKPTGVSEVFVDGKRKLRMTYDQELPTWNPPVTAHFYDSYDEIIWCGGWKYVMPDMFDESCKPEVSPCGKFPNQSPIWESTNVKNMFFAGTVTQGRDRRAASSFIHGFRYSAAILAKLLGHFRHNTSLCNETFSSINLDNFANSISQRFSTASAMYQLNYGVLCDVVVFNKDFDKATVAEGPDYKGSVQIYKELPTEWVLSQEQFTSQQHMWVLIFKDGRSHFPATMKPMEFSRPANYPEVDAACQAFIQPLVRRYSYGKLTEEMALGSNFPVRCDVDLLNMKGNSQRVPNKLRNLVLRELDIEGPKFDAETFNEANWKQYFTRWDEEKIADWKQKEAEKKAPKPCAPSMGPPRWARKGMEIVLQDEM